VSKVQLDIKASLAKMVYRVSRDFKGLLVFRERQGHKE